MKTHIVENVQILDAAREPVIGRAGRAIVDLGHDDGIASRRRRRSLSCPSFRVSILGFQVPELERTGMVKRSEWGEGKGRDRSDRWSGDHRAK